MRSPTSRPGRRLRTALAATVTTTAFVIGSLAFTAPAALASAPLPDVIPSIDGWQQVDGTFSASDDIAIIADGADAHLTSTAGILRDELRPDYPAASVETADAAAGDIELRVDDARDDLGAQGYDLQVGESIVITGADAAGVFNGTRTVLQMLTQQDTLPRGSVIDVPEYPERGVTVCACVINISTEFIDRLIEDMAFLKLNTLMVELKVKVDEYPQTNTWSYYTKEDITALVEKAKRYGIDVIPEINSPGHMEIWLENMPELQLTNESTGAKDEVRMDITKDASYDFYTDLIDEYFEAFDSDYWHMGVDEYMLGSGYANYPQIKRFAQQQFGAGATENDVVAWYVNKINDYVKSKGKTLRIWNDGVMRDNQFVDFDTDIIVEHWNQAGSTIKPQQFIDWGHEVNNISNSLYMVRGGYGVDSKGLYENGWTPEQFYGQKITSGADKILGARMSIWPDGGTPSEAENTTEQRMYEPLRFVAQSTWTDERPWATYADFKTSMDTIGRAPLWENADRQPLPSGAFTLSTDGGALAAGEGAGTVLSDAGETFTFTRTDDGYYTIASADGRCLSVAGDGTMRLNVPVEIGVDITLSTCATTTLQKWQVRKVDGGYTIANAASQQFVSVSQGLNDVPVAGEGFKNVADGRVVQTPADWGRTAWTVVGDVSVNVVPGFVTASPGQSADVTVTVNNSTGDALAGAALRVKAADGWTALPANFALDDIAASDSAEVNAKLFNVNAATGTGGFVFELVGADGTVIASGQTQANSVCAAGTVRPTAIAAVSSEQRSGEPAPNGPATAAIDGNPATYWHSQWSSPEAQYPHSIVIDLGEAQQVCGLVYTGRSSTGSGGANGRIGEYEVYASTDVATIDGVWGEPVSSGAFANTGDAQIAGFPAQSARYLKLVALSEVNGNPWATVGELAAAGPVQEAPSYEASITVDRDRAAFGGTVGVTGAGFAPGEPIEVVLLKHGPNTETLIATLTADAEGRIAEDVVVPKNSKGGKHQLILTGTVTGASDDAPLKLSGSGK
ncbi:family 20 glycosylhydrolase [Microbacterium sp. H1-D42]|uniref:family 20 glycosylhydrolase n=1 Tax=Microbacterium sp. H1-D42 TaxID=2925844 RepID=UPI001F52C3D1|nr:family 20 glycosylhydrolase [Microbacterium sp. H1-D42]UNK70814.1 family 20 glycosylhydrolase [Microbacterium sp. H1-D42]